MALKYCPVYAWKGNGFGDADENMKSKDGKKITSE